MSTIADQSMRAISATGWGGAELLAEIRTPRPAPSPTEVLVRVHAAGVNATDWKQRVTGGLGLWGDPPILGYDVSGTVEAVGLGVALFAPADAARAASASPRRSSSRTAWR
jgi:NADPH:quinone reductase-like Zn-dependent oxidoreductase